MSTDIRSRTGAPFNFVDGLKIKGFSIDGVKGATQIGTYVTPADTTPKLLQTWISETIVAIDQLKVLAGTGNTNPTSPDKVLTDSSSSNANTKFVQDLLALKLTDLLGGATAPLNTLKALAQAINNDATFSTTMANALASKATILDVQGDASTYSLASGSANAIIGAYTPAVTSLVDGMVLRVKALFANAAGTVTFSPNNGSVAFKTVVKGVSQPLLDGDIAGPGYPTWLQWDAANDRWVMLNPAYGVQTKYATVADTKAGLLTDSAVTPQGVRAVITDLVGAAPALVDTIVEIAAAINNDPNFATTINSQLALKAAIDSPTLTGAPKAPTPLSTDSSKLIATTEFVQAVVAAANQAGGVPNASTTTAGVSRYATDTVIAAGTDAATVVTPAGLAAVVNLYMKKDSPVFTGPVTAPTPPAGDNSTLVSTTEFATRLFNTIPNATLLLSGKARYATTPETLTGTIETAAVTPAGLAAKLATLPTVPDATTLVKGKARLAASAEALAGTSDTVALTPAGGKALLDQALANQTPPASFTAPVLTGNATLFQQKTYTLGLSATPVGSATSVVSFSVTVTNSNTATNVYNVSSTVTASNNAANFILNLPSQYSNSTLTFTVTATDNLGNTSLVASKSVQAVTVTVNAPVINSPTANQTNMSKTPTLSVSGFGVSADTDTQASSVWTIKNEAGTTTLWTSGVDTVNKSTISVPSGVLSSGIKYRLEVTFYATFYGASTTSTVYFTTAVAVVGELQKLTHPDTASIGKSFDFGYTMALSQDGNYAVVGSRTTDVAGVVSQGRAFVYYKSGASWTLQATLDIEVPEANAMFGYAVAIDAIGSRVFVSSTSSSEQTSGNGHVQVFARSGLSWSREAKLLPTINELTNSMEAYIDFGYNIATNLAGDVLAVGAPKGNEPYPALLDDSGFVYIYVRTGTAWAFQKRLSCSTPMANSKFGYDVDLSDDGNTLAVGNPFRNNNDNSIWYCGSGVIFRRTAGVWTQMAEFLAPNPAGSDYMGYSACISGNGQYAAFGAVYDDEVGSNVGAGHMFFYSGSAWTYQQKFVSDVPVANSFFGCSLAMSTNGDKILVGASMDTSGSATLAGKCYLYKRTGAVWALSNKLSASTIQSGAHYGVQVDMSANGDIGMVGAEMENNSSAPKGACYVLSV